MTFARRFVLLFFISCVVSGSRAQAAKDDIADQSRLAMMRLQQWYSPETGLWTSTGWWNAANALTTVIDFSRLTQTTDYEPVIQTSFEQHTHPGFLNEFYDDEGWWALAWIDAYDLIGNKEYLKTAASIFDDMTSGWDDTCNGGIWWKKDRHYKNAIANELFLDVAAHLANRATTSEARSHYLDWADREWRWFQQSSMIQPSHQINDGLDDTCKNNKKTVWTYNQGVIVGALAELSRLPGRSANLVPARQIALAAIQNMTDKQGVLHDVCEPDCGEDGIQFKGIFVRNLAILYARQPDRVYLHFFDANAKALLNNQNPDHSFGVVWSTPPGTIGAAIQSSAVDALLAELSAKGAK